MPGGQSLDVRMTAGMNSIMYATCHQVSNVEHDRGGGCWGYDSGGAKVHRPSGGHQDTGLVN